MARHDDPAALAVDYGCCLDARDWAGFRALFTDNVTLDYGAIGSIVGTISADNWTARCRLLAAFDATLHRVTNLGCRIEGDTAAVGSYVDALHFITVDGAVLCGQLAGHYRHDLIRTDAGWRIGGCRLTVAGYPLGEDAFRAAFAAARARFEEPNP